jgi:xanthine dehydrogenase molybdopterin-binding subunit B
MQKRETILLAILGVVVVVAIIVFAVAGTRGKQAAEDLLVAETKVSQSTQTVMQTIATAGEVLRSDKFLMLTTFGKIPVTVSPQELGKSQLF